MPNSFSGRIGRIALYLMGAAVLMAGCFGAMTYKLSGETGLWAMAAALAIGAVSNFAATLPASLALGFPEPIQPKSLLGGMLLRLVMLVLLTAPLLIAQVFPPTPLLLWLAGSYCVFLMVEVTLVACWMKQHDAR